MDALMRLRDTKVDMVLLDIDMPEMNSIETFECMKVGGMCSGRGRRKYPYQAPPGKLRRQSGH